MRLIFSEFPANYDKYHFPYQVWAVREKKDNLPQIYISGFLPFRSKKNLFYLSRSTRIRLSQFILSSENRRILQKTEALSMSLQPIEQFEYSPKIQKFCKTFADKKFGKGVMPATAINKIFTNSNSTHVFTFTTKENHEPIGYVAVVVHEHFIHYAHPFYNLEVNNSNIGMGMMLRAIQWAKDQTKQFAYLGTCYTQSSLYKTQFSGVEFFNGYKWSDNLDELKYLINKTDTDYTLQNEQYKEKFLENKLEEILGNGGVKLGFK